MVFHYYIYGIYGVYKPTISNHHWSTTIPCSNPASFSASTACCRCRAWRSCSLKKRPWGDNRGAWTNQ